MLINRSPAAVAKKRRKGEEKRGTVLCSREKGDGSLF